jgi:hypothetical protein
MVHETAAPASFTLPPIERDQLFLKLAKGRSHATQIVPNYKDFRLGHGDPLLQARMTHDYEMASPLSKKKRLQNLKDSGEIHLVQDLSPVSGMAGFNDIVHIDKNIFTSVPPCLPFETEGVDEKPETGGKNDIILQEPSLPRLDSDETPPEQIVHEKDHLPDHGSPLAGLGMSDIVHLADGSVLSIPCLPPEDRVKQD